MVREEKQKAEKENLLLDQQPSGSINDASQKELNVAKEYDVDHVYTAEQ